MASNVEQSDDEDVQIKDSLVAPELLQQWDSEQNLLKEKLILHDSEAWQFSLNNEQKIFKLSELDNGVFVEQFYKNRLRFVGGVDISYIKGCQDLACAGLIILDAADDLKIVYEDISMVEITQPYVAGYLAFREVGCLMEKLNKLKLERPEIYPQCVFIDGNGLLHPKRFGLACHLGVLIDTPTIGIAKQLFHVDGIEKNERFKLDIKEKLKKKGDYFELKSQNDVLGFCYRTCAENPIYVSVGHKINSKTCLLLVDLITTKYRIPEPTRLADLRTREYLRTNKNKTSRKKGFDPEGDLSALF